MGTRALKIVTPVILVAGLLLAGLYIAAIPTRAADELIPDWLLTPVPGLDGTVVSVDCCGDGELLCVTSMPEPYSVGFEVRNLFLDETKVLDFNWDPAENGWPGYRLGRPQLVEVFPNGSHVVVGFSLVPDNANREHCISIVLLLGIDDGKVSPIAVPKMPRCNFHFRSNEDGRYLVVYPVWECAPNLTSAEEFSERIDDLPGWKKYLNYNIETGESEFLDSSGLGLFNNMCPYSEYYCWMKTPGDSLEMSRAEIIDSSGLGYLINECAYGELLYREITFGDRHRNDYKRFVFGDLGSRKTTGRFLYIGETYTWVGWVKPDAALLKRDSDCVLACVDGSSTPAPRADWMIYWWFMDDSYLFSLDGGETIRYGLIDWECFDLDVSIELPLPAHFLDDYFIEDYVPQVGLILRGRDNSEHPGKYLRLSVGPGRAPDAVWNDR